MLEDGDDADPRGAADRGHAAAGAARPAATATVDRSTATAAAGTPAAATAGPTPPPTALATRAPSGLMLARIAHELYWLGRNLARAEFTARAVEAVFQAELQGTSESTPGVSFGSGGLLAMFGAMSTRATTASFDGQALGQLTLDASARVDAREHRAGTRGRATVRDVISAEMWEAIKTTALGLRGGGQPGWRLRRGRRWRRSMSRNARR